jgi:hypothetical protein
MASIHKEIPIAAAAAAVWDAVRDFGAVHVRVAPGFVVDARRDGEARIVTFANGMVVRELLVDCDDERRRLVYAIAPNERIAHYSAAIEVTGDGPAGCRVSWTVDVLPDALAPVIAAQMDFGVAAMQKTLNRAAI